MASEVYFSSVDMLEFKARNWYSKALLSCIAKPGIPPHVISLPEAGVHASFVHVFH